jgi:hypothetical protein
MAIGRGNMSAGTSAPSPLSIVYSARLKLVSSGLTSLRFRLI